MVLATLGPNTLFGDMALIGQGMYDSFTEASEQSEMCIMNRWDLEGLILAKPAVGLRLLRATSQRLQEAETTLEDMAFKRPPAIAGQPAIAGGRGVGGRPDGGAEPPGPGREAGHVSGDGNPAPGRIQGPGPGKPGPPPHRHHRRRTPAGDSQRLTPGPPGNLRRGLQSSPARWRTRFFRYSRSYWLRIPIISITGEPPPCTPAYCMTPP